MTKRPDPPPLMRFREVALPQLARAIKAGKSHPPIYIRALNKERFRVMRVLTNGKFGAAIDPDAAMFELKLANGTTLRWPFSQPVFVKDVGYTPRQQQILDQLRNGAVLSYYDKAAWLVTEESDTPEFIRSDLFKNLKPFLEILLENEYGKIYSLMPEWR